MENISISFRIAKATATGRYVSGWLSVVQKDGKRVEDTQGDLISMGELQKGVHKYMRGSRVIKKQHSGDQIGEMVEIVMIDDDFAKAHGITHTKRGAWGTAEITDEEVRKDVRDGKVQGWSMGGRGKRTPIEKASVFRGGSLVARKRLQRLSVQNSSRAATGDRRAISRGRKIGAAQSYLTRRLARQGHVFKAAELIEAIEKARRGLRYRFVEARAANVERNMNRLERRAGSMGPIRTKAARAGAKLDRLRLTAHRLRTKR